MAPALAWPPSGYASPIQAYSSTRKSVSLEETRMLPAVANIPRSSQVRNAITAPATMGFTLCVYSAFERCHNASLRSNALRSKPPSLSSYVDIHVHK
jgi:hypothetical protein